MAHFTTSSSFPYIVLLLLVPLLGSLAAVLLPKKHSETARWVGIGASVVTLGLVIAMTIAFQTTNGGYQFVSQHSWASELGISWISGIDGISLFMVGLTALITPIVLLGASEKKRTKSYVAWMLLLEFACIGSFVSMDMILFFLFFELTLIP